MGSLGYLGMWYETVLDGRLDRDGDGFGDDRGTFLRVDGLLQSSAKREKFGLRDRDGVTAGWFLLLQTVRSKVRDWDGEQDGGVLGGVGSNRLQRELRQ